jgi:hypothetical protein
MMIDNSGDYSGDHERMRLMSLTPAIPTAVNFVAATSVLWPNDSGSHFIILEHYGTATYHDDGGTGLDLCIHTIACTHCDAST